jgi:hypothetical protein
MVVTVNYNNRMSDIAIVSGIFDIENVSGNGPVSMLRSTG